MNDILLLLHDDPGQEARLQAGMDLVRALDGHLRCLDVTALPDQAYRTAAGPIAAMVLERAASSERLNKDRILPRLAARAVDFSWEDVTDELEPAMVAAGRLADLIVINTVLPSVEFPDMLQLARALLEALHAPLLAIPPDAVGFNAGGHAVVLWDGSADAEAAICAAVPLLLHASRVTIVAVSDETEALPAREASEYLQRHGIISHTTHLEAVGEHPAHVIGRFLRRREPAWVVMGAFGHGRVHDALFGSVTGHLMATSRIPLFLARRI